MLVVLCIDGACQAVKIASLRWAHCQTSQKVFWVHELRGSGLYPCKICIMKPVGRIFQEILVRPEADRSWKSSKTGSSTKLVSFTFGLTADACTRVIESSGCCQTLEWENPADP